MDMGLVRLAVCLFTPQFSLELSCTYPRRDGQAELSLLTWVAGDITRLLIPLPTVTHPSTNWAWHQVTFLIETSMLATDPSHRPCYL